MPTAPPPPRVRLSLGVTGHRVDNAAFAANRAEIEAVFSDVLDVIAAAIAAEPRKDGYEGFAATRMHSLLADGADQLAAREALARGWELVAPLPFGRALNAAINARPANAGEVRALLTGKGLCGRQTRARAQAIGDLVDAARCLELADADATVEALFMEMMKAPKDVAKAQAFSVVASERVALAGRVLIEQSDIVIGVWDGATRAFIGGTGHTIATALDQGAAVVWIDTREPRAWRILQTPESLAGLIAPSPVDGGREAELAALVRAALRPDGVKPHGHAHDDHIGQESLAAERWRTHSNGLWHGYRRIEALFGAGTWAARFRSLRQTYETPDAIAGGSGLELLHLAKALPGADAGFAGRIEHAVLRRFAWADGISSHLSDAYRGGMASSFILSPLAIVGGLAFLPFGTQETKWRFEVFELALLTTIVAITLIGQRRRWHARWFETRRIAEYLRHGAILLLMGVARPPGRWPRGTQTSWPEWYARHALREVGLPQAAITPAYIRAAIGELLGGHIASQRDYHRYKAKRLAAAHRRLDRFSEFLFSVALLAVAGYLGLDGAAALGWIPHEIPHSVSNLFTFLGVALPTFGAAIAGIRYFGDFERFSAISEISAERLDGVCKRIALLLAAPDDALDYGRAAELVHAADDIVVAEIENWQAVFGGKHITVPV
ncbi:hypothetical protein BH11PSE2_BH11PSE2_21100 [soil metagenome]